MRIITQPIILSIMLSIGAFNSHAQTFDEWFKQKETQIKYLLEQITALEAYGQVINKGYDISQNGLTNIFNSKEGDFRLNGNYLRSLWKVRAGIKSYSKVSAIFGMKADIEKCSRLIKSSTTEFLNDTERSYVDNFYHSLESDCHDLAGELQMVINDDLLQLKDDERIQRIDQIYRQMQDRDQFSQSFANEIKQLVISRVKEEKKLINFISFMVENNFK